MHVQQGGNFLSKSRVSDPLLSSRAMSGSKTLDFGRCQQWRRIILLTKTIVGM